MKISQLPLTFCYPCHFYYLIRLNFYINTSITLFIKFIIFSSRSVRDENKILYLPTTKLFDDNDEHFFFSFSLAAPRLFFGQYQRESFIDPMLVSAFCRFLTRRSPGALLQGLVPKPKVWSLNLSERLVGFESITIRPLTPNNFKISLW